jgi:hypothetical protein
VFAHLFHQLPHLSVARWSHVACLSTRGEHVADRDYASEWGDVIVVGGEIQLSLSSSLAVLDQAPTSVIETHSENLLLRVQIAIASGELPADKVIVHWVRPLDRGSVIDTITFDHAARPLGAGWPPGVFSEDLVQARALLAIRKEKGLA